ncbi:helix-turn-helix domain-containing protein [Geomonas subterranea]|uniref:helix-turn-helix domain-containing protein n=1 Tax=Geomonas subterranea TaxID=2847989 RepID=UPI001CD1CFB8|nr:helix-turn-helix transcriptional regulator [Geomonas fuzhouensis]
MAKIIWITYWRSNVAMPTHKLAALGARLRAERLKRDMPQAEFAARLDISIPTLHKMESGDPGVQVGYWMIALEVLDRAKEVDILLAGQSVSDESAPASRKRASKKNRK